MSFSFSASGNPGEVIAAVGAEAAKSPQIPQSFADAINQQLSGLPADASLGLSCWGHTGWGSAQTAGNISLHVDMTVTAAQHPSVQPEA